jgi:uncharacterized membrane protein
MPRHGACFRRPWTADETAETTPRARHLRGVISDKARRRKRVRRRRNEKGERDMATRSTGMRTKVLLASAVAGLLAVSSLATPAAAAEKESGKVKCYGANKCKGSGACAGAGHACAGKNACKGQGFVETDSKEACLKMEGGRLTPDAPK